VEELDGHVLTTKKLVTFENSNVTNLVTFEFSTMEIKQKRKYGI
jgi:hypothetical protein